jgi:hypothetical protein
MTTMTIAARELRERSRLLIFAAALAVLPFIAAVLPGSRANRIDVIAAVSSFLALALPLAAAAGLGASTIVRDLVERRLSFYFSKPVSPAAIWLGKAAASIFVCFACFAIIAVPSLLVARKSWPLLWMMTGPQMALIVGAGVVVLFFLGHFVSSVVRSKSVLVAIDFVCAAASVAIVALLTRQLLIGGAVQLARAIGYSVAAAVLIVIAIAPIWQLRNGRTDIRRSHAALSRFLWPAVLAVVAVAAIYVLWVISVSPSKLSAVVYLEQPAKGERVFVSGSGRNRGDYHASFLLQPDGWKRIRNVVWSPVTFSRDGSVLAWYEWTGVVPRSEVELYTDRGPTGIRTHGYVDTVLSDDGSRVAIGRGELVTVFDLRSGKLLASAGGFDRQRQHLMYFATNDLVRVIELHARVAHTLHLFELDVARKKLSRTGSIALPDGDSVIASSDGSKLLLRRARRVLDARTGATLSEVAPGNMTASVVLNDGRVVQTFRDGRIAKVRVTGGKEVVLPVAAAAIAGELADGIVLVNGAKRIGASVNGSERMAYVVDLDRGAIVQTHHDVKGPQTRWWDTDPRLVRYEGRLSGVNREGEIVWWDPRVGGR